MDTMHFDADIKVFYVAATSFPAGVMEAHNKLHEVVLISGDRKFFGLSRPENGTIEYKAAAEEVEDGEAEKFNLPAMLLKSGDYTCITITDYMKDIPAIGKAFTTLLANPDLDPQGYCVEWYFNDKDLRCMIRLNK